MPYMEDPDFWYSIKDRKVFDENYRGDEIRDYWNWFHDHSDEGLHTWEDGADDWEDDCWYEKHDLKFTAWDLGQDTDKYEAYQIFYDPCNEWH
jgi:hypothetical protein